MSGLNSVGGVFGKTYSDNGVSLTMKNCSNNVKIEANCNYVGGAIGFAQGYESYGSYYGGIKLYNFKQSGDIKGGDYVGSVIGKAYIGVCSHEMTIFEGTVYSYLETPSYINDYIGRRKGN